MKVQVGKIASQAVMVVVVIPLEVQRENDPRDHFTARFSLFHSTVHAPDLAATRENSPPDCFLMLGAARVVRPVQSVLGSATVAD